MSATDTIDVAALVFEFDRYINGVLMAEGVTIERAATLEKAMFKAAKIASRGPNGEVPVLVLRPATALQSQADALAEARRDLAAKQHMWLYECGKHAEWLDKFKAEQRRRIEAEDGLVRALGGSNAE